MGRNVLASMIGVATNPKSLAASARPAVQKRAAHKNQHNGDHTAETEI